jgi:hypothetical protein
MSDGLEVIQRTLESEAADVPERTRRQFVGRAAAAVGGLGSPASCGSRPPSSSGFRSVFASRSNFLNTLVVGDQIFVNAYLIGVATFAKADPKLAAVPAEFMGAEAVHRALALQSLGQLGNDRIFMKVEFTNVLDAVTRLQAAGFGFGAKGSEAGALLRLRPRPHPHAHRSRRQHAGPDADRRLSARATAPPAIAHSVAGGPRPHSSSPGPSRSRSPTARGRPPSSSTIAPPGQ